MDSATTMNRHNPTDLAGSSVVVEGLLALLGLISARCGPAA